MPRWIVLAAALATTGCFNGLLLKPTTVHEPVAETTVTEPCHWYCRDKIAIIDVDGLIMNAKSSGLLSDGDNPVSLFREKLEAAGLTGSPLPGGEKGGRMPRAIFASSLRNSENCVANLQGLSMLGGG